MEKKETSKRLGMGFNVGEEEIWIYGDSIDELIIALEELKDGSIIIRFIEKVKNLSKEQLKRIDRLILTFKEIEVIYEYFMKRIKIDNEIANFLKYEDAIIASKNAEYIYQFAINVKGGDISKLQDAIIASENAEYIYEFARDVKGADISKLQDSIIASQKVLYIHRFAMNVTNADISELQDAIIASKNAEYIYYFAMNVNGADISKLQDAIIETKDVNYIYSFAKKSKKDFREVKKAVKKTKDAELIREYRKIIKELKCFF